MFENTRKLLGAGDKAGARTSFRRELGEFFQQSFVAGRAEHPIFGPKARELVDFLQSAGPVLVPDESRSTYLGEVLDDVGSRMFAEEDAAGAVFLFNHALHLIDPEYPLLVQ